MNEPAASRQTRARTETPIDPLAPDAAAVNVRAAARDSDPRNEQAAGSGGGPRTGPGGQVMSRTPTSGAKGFAVILGAMLGIIGLLWLIATLVAPH
jgi:hypothetical protein